MCKTKMFLPRPLHKAIAVVSNGEDVRGKLADFFLPIHKKVLLFLMMLQILFDDLSRYRKVSLSQRYL
jgi:hypothetical protein